MNSSRVQRAGKRLSHQDRVSVVRSPLVWERLILELISVRAPLADILGTLCTAMDIQIGSTVSLVLVSHQQERDVDAIARCPEEVGLHTFWSAAILSRGDDLLGTLEILCCAPRVPTANEVLVIERVTYLAAVAIQGEPRDLLN